MRPLSRIALAGAALSLALAPSAGAANSLSAKFSPNKGGELTVAAPTTITLKAATPDRRPTMDGNQKLKAVVAKLPTEFVYNPIPFKECTSATFLVQKTCPSSTRLGTVDMIADGGPSVGDIDVDVTLYFGTGYTILARVQADKPAVIDETIVGDLRSSGTRGYGLAMYIPVTPLLQMPLPNLYPTVKTIDAKVKPMTKSTRVPGSRKKVKLPIVGLGPCTGSKRMNFGIDVQYTNAAGADVIATDSATGKATCRK